MHLFRSSLLLAVAASVSTSSASLGHKNEHGAVKKSHVGHNNTRSLGKRTYSGQATWFDDGLGACGIYNSPSDLIVALDTPLYGSGSPGPECFRYVQITAVDSGITAVAQITDECPGCAYGSLDMSQGLFKIFNPLSVGEFAITWNYVDGNGDDDAKAAQKTTTHHTTKTTSTTQSTTATTPTTTSEAISSSTTSSISSSLSGTVTPSAIGTATSASATSTTATGNGSTGGGNLGAQARLVANIGNLAAFAQSSS